MKRKHFHSSNKNEVEFFFLIIIIITNGNACKAAWTASTLPTVTITGTSTSLTAEPTKVPCGFHNRLGTQLTGDGPDKSPQKLYTPRQPRYWQLHEFPMGCSNSYGITCCCSFSTRRTVPTHLTFSSCLCVCVVCVKGHSAPYHQMTEIGSRLCLFYLRPLNVTDNIRRMNPGAIFTQVKNIILLYYSVSRPCFIWCLHSISNERGRDY